MRFTFPASALLCSLKIGSIEAFSIAPFIPLVLFPKKLCSTTDAFPRTRRNDSNNNHSWRRYAKPKQTSPIPAVTNDDDDDDDSSLESSAKPTTTTAIPANLRRKIQAKRPPLGHIIPQHTKIGGGGGGSSNPRLRPQGKARIAGLNNPSMLKIAGGSAKGRRLDSPNVYLRPMMAKVREAVFSTFHSFGLYDSNKINTTKHLDVFAGSGSVGLESLSRGAGHCTFVDFSKDCCEAVERNVKWCQFQGKASIIHADALAVFRTPTMVGIPKDTVFQIVTLCPPYEEVVYGDLLEAVAMSDLVTDDTVVLVEYPVELGTLPHVIPGMNGSAMVGVRNRRYGRTVIAMYVNNPTGALSDSAGSRPEEFVKL
jgi:16S rRNA (guanine966-N2)-methyltransferase